MLEKLLPTLKEEAARECAGKLLKDNEALKMLHSAPLCCKMHEFWSMLGVSSLDLNDFLIHCPRHKAREFTMASSPTATPDRITLCVSLTSHQLPDLGPTIEKLKEAGYALQAPGSGRGRFFGACSRWLTSRLKTGDVIFAKVRSSLLRLPEKDVPVLMVGSGAGVAPFRGFWEEIRKGPRVAPCALFFGCRHPDQDWLFKEEMNGAEARGQWLRCARARASGAQAAPRLPPHRFFTPR
jgi:sulfite reductase alpha subunit-like flavoprotein